MNVAPLGPVAGSYYLDNSRVAVILGPVGSGKSTASCLRLARHAYQQQPMPDGVARTRWAIVRNTKPQLKDTTIKTWLQVFPEAQYGQFLRGDNLSHTWRFKPKGWQYPIEAEFLFRALDDQADIANMLSLELTGFYFNECREIDEQIIVHAGRRAGRFPPRSEGGCTWSGWIGDSNPWDTEHYLYRDLTEGEKAPDWKLFVQPGGMDANAENRENLPPGYYENALKDYSKEDADVYVHAKYGRTKSGKPIYIDYVDSIHCKPFELSPHLPIRIGIDFGRTPAATIGQLSPNGNWRIRYELCAFDMGIKVFGATLVRFLEEKVPRWPIGNVTGDPSGNAKDGSDQTAFDLLKASKLIASPATTNELSVRIEAVNGGFRRMADGEPGLIIHPDCKMLRRACIDGYRFRKLAVMGNRYADEPDKNEYSHVAEALQYMLLGGGEEKVVRARRPTGSRARYAIT
ncbi:MAG: terminase family protein [Steroidobacteraceae bacterium]